MVAAGVTTREVVAAAVRVTATTMMTGRAASVPVQAGAKLREEAVLQLWHSWPLLRGVSQAEEGRGVVWQRRQRFNAPVGQGV
jgi:hypothetical protein